MLAEGERSPKVVGVTSDGRTVELGPPGRRTVLWFSPKSGRVDEVGDVLLSGRSP